MSSTLCKNPTPNLVWDLLFVQELQAHFLLDLTEGLDSEIDDADGEE